MASRDFENLRTLHNEAVVLAFTFAVDGSSVASVVSTTGSASFVTVAKKGASTGIYAFTFADTWQDVLFASMVPFKAAGTLDMKVDECTESNKATSTALVVEMQVKKSSDGTALDPVSLSFKCLFILRNSTVAP